MYQPKQLLIPSLSSQEESVLKIQNTSLANRVDFLKKTIKEQKQIIRELVEREIRHQKFFSSLELTWRGFLSRSLRIESIVRKKGLLENKYLNAFQYLDDIFNSQYLMCNNVEGQFKKQISHKFEQFLRLIENIYFEISLEYSDFVENIQQRTNELCELEEQDYLAYVKKLITTIKEQVKKNQEIEQSLKQIQRVKEKKINDIDGQLAFQSVYQLQTIIAESKKQNETLSRRLRMLSNYSEKSITQKLNEEEENYECICGGTQIKQAGPVQALDLLRQSYEFIDDRSQQTSRSEKKIVNILLIQQLLLRALKSRQIKITNDDDQFSITFTQQEIKDLEMILTNYFNSLQKTETLQVQNKKFQQQVLALQTKVKELEINCEYREDQFVESETFSLLNAQNLNLIDSNSQLTQHLQALQTQYQELLTQKQSDINQLQKFYDQEIQKICAENGQLKKLFNEHQNRELKYPNFEREYHNHNLQERYEQQKKIIDAQNGENKALKDTNKELRTALEDLNKQFQDLQNKINDLEIKNIALITKIPGELNLDQLSFRHTKHKEYLQEALNIIIKYQPQFKDKFQELIGYVKTRDQRIEQFEKEVAKKDKTLSEQRRHQQMMLDECDYNSKIYEEVMAKSKQVETQLSVKEKNEAQLIQDKQAEKTRFELERTQLKEKERQQQEQINQLQQQRANQTQLIQKYSQEKISLKENYGELVKQVEYYKTQYEKIFNELNIMKVERDCYQQKIQKSKLINEESLLNITKQEQKIIELEQMIEQQEQLLNNPAQLEQMKGYLILKKEDQINEQNLLIKLKTTACCSECKTQLKEVIIQKCMHMLCKECADQAQFKEQCPVCKININIVDIWATKIQE